MAHKSPDLYQADAPKKLIFLKTNITSKKIV